MDCNALYYIWNLLSSNRRRHIVLLLVNLNNGGTLMNPITLWKQEAQEAYTEYRNRDCGTRVYTKDKICIRAEYAIINAYLDYLCFTKGPRIAGNHRRYVNRGEKERKDEVQIIVREWNLS